MVSTSRRRAGSRSSSALRRSGAAVTSSSLHPCSAAPRALYAGAHVARKAPGSRLADVSGLSSTVRRSNRGVLVRHVGRYERTRWREDATYKWIFVPRGRYAVESQRFTTSLGAGQFLVLNPGTRHRHLGLDGEKRLAELEPDLVCEAARAMGADSGWLRRGPSSPSSAAASPRWARPSTTSPRWRAAWSSCTRTHAHR
jgi:hypothetical protein